MIVKCIKYYKDEYGFVYNVGEIFEVDDIKPTYLNDHYYYKTQPGKGPWGSLAISNLSKEDFIDIKKVRSDKLELLGI